MLNVQDMLPNISCTISMNCTTLQQRRLQLNCTPGGTTLQQRRLQLNCTPGGVTLQQRRLQLNCTPGGTTLQQRRLQWNCTPGGTTLHKEDCSRTPHPVAPCHSIIFSSTAKRASSLMSSKIQTQDMEVRSIVTYLTFICFKNVINAHQQICQKPCIFHACSEASPTCSGFSAIITMILTNTQPCGLVVRAPDY